MPNDVANKHIKVLAQLTAMIAFIESNGSTGLIGHVLSKDKSLNSCLGGLTSWLIVSKSISLMLGLILFKPDKEKASVIL